MNPTVRNIVVGVVAGVLVAVALWAVGGPPREARAQAAVAGGDVTDVRSATSGRQAPAYRARPGTTRIVERRADVDGGADWVLERFVLRNRPFAPFVRVPPGPVTCVRLGRLVGGRVTWIDALGRAGSVPRTRQPTLCTVDPMGREVVTYATLDARGGRVRRRAVVTFGLGRVSAQRDRRRQVLRRGVVPTGGVRGELRVDRLSGRGTPVRAGARPRPDVGGFSGLPERTRERIRREMRRDVSSGVEDPIFVSQAGTPVGTVGMTVGRMPGRDATCIASGVTPGFLGIAGTLRGPLGVVEVDPVFECRRIPRSLATLPSANVGFLRGRAADGRLVSLATASVLAPPGVERVELRTVAGVQTVRVVSLGSGPGVAVGVWPQAGAGQDDFGPSAEVVGIRRDGGRVRPRDAYVEPPPPTADIAFGP